MAQTKAFHRNLIAPAGQWAKSPIETIKTEYPFFKLLSKNLENDRSQATKPIAFTRATGAVSDPNKAGLEYYIQTYGRLTSLGVSKGETLTGNEERLSDYVDRMTINELWHAVDLPTSINVQSEETRYNDSIAYYKSLGMWLYDRIQMAVGLQLSSFDANTFIDFNGQERPLELKSLGFNRVRQLPKENWVIAGDKDKESDLVAGDEFTLDTLLKMKSAAMNRPMPIPKIQENGKSYYLVVLHPTQYDQLRKDPAFRDTVSVAYSGQGANSPYIDGEFTMYDGMHIWSTTLLTTHGVNPDKTINRNVVRGYLLGANAAHFRQLYNPQGSGINERIYDKTGRWKIKPAYAPSFLFYVSNESKDYGRRLGTGVGAAFGISTTDFGGQAYNRVLVSSGVGKSRSSQLADIVTGGGSKSGSDTSSGGSKDKSDPAKKN